MKKLLSIVALFGLVCVGMLSGCKKQSESMTPPSTPPSAPAMPSTNAPAATNAPAQ